MAVRRKPQRRKAWQQYEAEKKSIAARSLSPAEYERAVRQLAKKCRL